MKTIERTLAGIASGAGLVMAIMFIMQIVVYNNIDDIPEIRRFIDILGANSIGDIFTFPPNNTAIMNIAELACIINLVVEKQKQPMLIMKDGKILDIRYMTDGCGPTIACGSMTMRMTMGKELDDALALSSDDLIKALDGLPDENIHCAYLSIDTLQKAVTHFLNKT